MIVTCNKILEEKRLHLIDFESAIETISKGEDTVWIDIIGAEKHELAEKLDELGIQGLIRRFSISSYDHPGFYPLKPISLIVLPVHTEKQDLRNLEYLGLLYNDGFLLSYHDKEFIRFQKDLVWQDYVTVLPDNSISGLISSLFFGQSMVSLRKTAFFSENILTLEKKMDRNPEEINVEEISELQTEMLLLESVVHGQLPIFQSFAATEKGAIHSGKTAEYLALATANLQSANRSLEWLERRIIAIRSIYDAQAREKTNRRLERLTILSAIFMPISFLAGIWGMNFENMPLLSHPHGYWTAVAIMVVISTGMFFYFKRKEWID
ncbi:magnesium transporter CorA family protein [Cognataquiflexum rubidum]|uniref:magnesium transporter CorA family protein n=1 Tax=Cognataquiflexum rubidum TaxID=2922273 RepID=UPI001F12F3CC|nr:CorA family divalent cation transporter [Cognataquiflexum rubidum]MCH6236714.1 CorA family divalent cation transporter [Cognataquiflexum rubidum]